MLYNSIVSYDVGADDEFSGGAIAVTYAASNNLAFRGAIFSLEHDDLSELESSGYDLVVYGGTGLIAQGFKVYGGVGVFKDTWEFFDVEEDFSGLQLSGGLGYNWDAVALDFVIGIRDVGDLATSVLGVSADTAISGNLSVSFRF